MNLANLQTEWAALLFKSLADAGVRDIVVSPGSRSTPFVVAAVREKRLSRHSVIDERSAAFFALGQARVTGVPSVLLCTSGTAAAQYLPAMIEAAMTGTPMIVMSSDRPHELYHCSAPQTIDQVKLFGEYARQFFDLVPDGSPAALRSVRRIAAQAVLASAWPRPGAVHINARARKPLEPVAASTPGEEALASLVRALAAEPLTMARTPRTIAAAEAIDEAATVIRSAKRGLIVAGPASLAQRAVRKEIWSLARATGFAVACEATSQLRFVRKPADVHILDGFELLLRSKTFRESAPFDVAIQVGAPPTCGPWEQLAPDLQRVVLSEHGWPDPYGSARVLLFGDVGANAASIGAVVADAPPRLAPSFHDGLRRANTAAWIATEREIEATDGLVEAAAVRVLIDQAPEHSLIMMGNSLSVRLVDIYARATERDIGVLSQRGASGIDGLVAGAAGAAAATNKPLAIVIGDVSLLYDLTSLALTARSKTPLLVFLLHNGGGRIFEQLPVVDVPGIEPEIVEHATTPHDTDFASASALYGIRYARAATLEETRAAIVAAYSYAGCTLVEVRVPPHGATALSRRVTKAIEAAVAPLIEKTIS